MIAFNFDDLASKKKRPPRKYYKYGNPFFWMRYWTIIPILVILTSAMAAPSPGHDLTALTASLCGVNQALQNIGQGIGGTNGYACVALPTGTVTSVGSGAGLAGGPITTSGTLKIKDCTSGQILKSGGANVWNCGADNDSNPWSSNATGISYSGRVGIGGAASASYQLNVTGTIHASGTISSGSSEKIKKNIVALTDENYADVLRQLNALEVYFYQYKSRQLGNKLHMGVISEKAPAQIVSQDGKGVEMLDYLGFLLATVKAQQEEINQLKVQVQELQQQEG